MLAFKISDFTHVLCMYVCMYVTVLNTVFLIYTPIFFDDFFLYSYILNTPACLTPCMCNDLSRPEVGSRTGLVYVRHQSHVTESSRISVDSKSTRRGSPLTHV